MSKMEQILVIKPTMELTFFGPFNQQVSSVMHLSNPSDKKVCFKIKTTAPKRYCVKPNSGVVDPEETVKISVSLQPFDYDPLEKSKHKFMVQSMYAPKGEINQDLLWKEADGSQLMDSKLKCIFVMPETSEGGGGSNDNFKGFVLPSVGVAGGPSAPSADHLTNSYQPPAENEHLMGGNKGASKAPFSQGDMTDIIGDGDGVQRKSAEEIRKLQEEISSLRQENIQLREETLRQQRLATSRVGAEAEKPSSRHVDSLKVAAMNPDATALSPTYLYLGLAILVLGVIIGKWIF